VAVRAFLPDVSEHRLDVALRTGHALVHAPQRVSGRVVIKFRNCPDGFPAALRVTILAGNAKAAMGAARVGRRLLLARRRVPTGHHRQGESKIQ
jgi:hypothetical protein